MHRGNLMGSLSDAARTALVPVLGPTERVAVIAPAVGCTLVLTDRQLLLVRDGVSYRPRSGVQSWALDRSLGLRVGPVRHGTGRLAIEYHGHGSSVFVTQAQLDDVAALVAQARRRIYGEGRPAADEPAPEIDTHG